MKFAEYVVPIMIAAIFIFGCIKKVKMYDAFTEGVKSAIPLAVSIFPFLVTIFVLTEIFEVSGVSAALIKFLSPFVSKLGIPPEITKLVLLKPLSGSGSLALLSEILATYGADSYIGRCASVVFGSSETIFYIAAIYLANVKVKKTLKPILVSVSATFISNIAACLLCRIM